MTNDKQVIRIKNLFSKFVFESLKYVAHKKICPL